MQEHPILNRIGSVFVPVTNMSRAITFYARLLNVHQPDTSHEGQVFAIPMDGDASLVLLGSEPGSEPGSAPATPAPYPLFFFWTDDIRAARHFLIESGIESAGEIVDGDAVRTVTFPDPDGNLLMVAQRKE